MADGWCTKNGLCEDPRGGTLPAPGRVMRVVAFFFALAPLALSSLCFAEEGDSIGPRLGIAVGGVIGLARNWPGGDDPLTFGRGRPAGRVGPQVDAAALNPTLQLDLGVRFNLHVGAFIRGEAGTSGLASQAAAYAIVEWTPAPRWSLGTGIGWDGMVIWQGTAWSAVSIPLVAGFDVAPLNRGALRIGLEAAAGLDPSTSTVGWHAALTFGWALN